MWCDGLEEVAEMFKNAFPVSFLFFVPIFILISPISPVASAHDFAVYRMQQYDLQGNSFGCKNAILNVEARPIDAQVLTRRCVVTKLREMTSGKFKDALAQNAAGVLVILPRELSELTDAQREHLMELEQEMLQEDVKVPVYFTPETPEINDIYYSMHAGSNSDQAGSAFEALMGAAVANGFQLLVNGPASAALSDFQVTNIQGKLSGYGIEEQLPTIAVVAHYDSFGVAPSLSKGADSNGSGVVALLELARLFSKLYTNSRTHAKFNILFLLSGAGKFNYQGTKRWIEDQLESSETTLLSEASYILCLDTIGSGNELNLHVSKPPKEGSAGGIFVENLKAAQSHLAPEKKFHIVHKKINLADDFLAWEHERFSIKRLPAFTMSHLDNPKKNVRTSIVDTRETVDVPSLATNIKILSEALARHVFNISSTAKLEVFNDGLRVEETFLTAWLDYLSSRSRAAQVLDKKSPVVATLEQGLARYLKEVKSVPFKADKRDPDFVFYSGTEYTMSAYNVKPAVFDLFLGAGIAAYLGVLYLMAMNFNIIYMTLRKVVGPIKAKVH